MRWKFLVIILLWLCASSLVFAAPNSLPKISIIIDDLGNNQYWDYKVAELPGPVVCSILPYTFYSLYVDRLCHSVNKEIILHTPMQALSPHSLGPGGLSVNLSQAQFETILNNDIHQIPYLSGINNHMGSLLTEKPAQMTWVMEVIKPKGLFYIDSRTSGGSIAENVAKDDGVRTAGRDIFLDDIRTTAAVRQQFELLLADARNHGSAIAIGHPYPATITFLQQELPQLQAQGYELVPVSDLLQYNNGRQIVQLQKPIITKMAINPPLPAVPITPAVKVIPVAQPIPEKLVQTVVLSKPKVAMPVKIVMAKPVSIDVMKIVQTQLKELQAYLSLQKQSLVQNLNEQDEEMQLRVTIWQDKLLMLQDSIFASAAKFIQQTQIDLQMFDQESTNAYEDTRSQIKNSFAALEPKENPVTVVSQKLQRAQTQTAIQVAKNLPVINVHEIMLTLKPKIKPPVKNTNIIVEPYVSAAQVAIAKPVHLVSQVKNADIIVEPFVPAEQVAIAKPVFHAVHAKAKLQARSVFPTNLSHITPVESFALDLLQYELCPQSIHACRVWY